MTTEELRNAIETLRTTFDEAGTASGATPQQRHAASLAILMVGQAFIDLRRIAVALEASAGYQAQVAGFTYAQPVLDIDEPVPDDYTDANEVHGASADPEPTTDTLKVQQALLAFMAMYGKGEADKLLAHYGMQVPDDVTALDATRRAALLAYLETCGLVE